VLRPGGRLAPFWHVFQPPPAVVEAFATAYRRVVPESSFDLQAMMKPALDTYQAMFAMAADGMREVGGFSEPEQWRFDWERSYSRAEWLDHLPTQAPLTRLEPDKLAEVLDASGWATPPLSSPRPG
jgi:hypothetical protein